MGRPAKKKAYWEGKKAEAGKLQALREYKRKTPLGTRLLDWFEESLKNVNPLQLVATAGITVLVHNYIINSKDLKEKLQSGDQSAFWAIFQQGAIQNVLTAGGVAIADLTGKQDWAIWLVSIGIAYVLVTQGGAMIGGIASGISKIVPMFFGVE